MRPLTEDVRHRAQVAWRNVRANRGWRPADMVNWHRMVRPLRAMAPAGGTLDMYQLVYDLCTRLEVRYEPHLVARAPQPRPREGNPMPGEPRVGLFADAPDHLSGVCLTLSEWAAAAYERDRELVIHGCGTGGGATTVMFPPMGSLWLQAYDGLRLHVPHVSEVLRYAERSAFDVIHVSTPGPMGLLGLLVARQAGVPVCGTYHTDFPRYASALTGDPQVESVGWRFMQWFYGQMDLVAAPTPSIRRELAEHGFAEDRLTVVGRGVDTARFAPAKRSETWRARWGARQPVKLLYVGRVSREKNLPLLAEAFRLLAARRHDVCLVVVGDGPYREEMESALRGLPACFPGVLHGADLEEAYASSDLFVFPSETDTFGRVVLEAQASGLPVVVSGAGGPKDAMVDGETGVVVSPMSADALAHGVARLLDGGAFLPRMSAQARAHARTRTREASFDAFWNLHRRLVADHPRLPSPS
jgi:glycosyltransferase involved in cell wall biosynthesis